MRPDIPLAIATAEWTALTRELHGRTSGVHESGAFLLGTSGATVRRVIKPVFYDDLDPDAYCTGIVRLQADSFTRLWTICAAEGLSVIADVHVHAEEAWQSLADRTNPMIAQAGHIALILPWFAKAPINLSTIGLYRYLGGHRWTNLGGRRVHSHFILEP